MDVNYNTRHFVIILSYLLSFFKTLKLAAKTIIGLKADLDDVAHLYSHESEVLHVFDALCFMGFDDDEQLNRKE